AEDGDPKVRILFSGTAHTAARQAAVELPAHYGISAELVCATSYKALREEALAVERWNLLHPNDEPKVPHVTRLLSEHQIPTSAVSDFMKMVPDQVARWIPGPDTALGTDGFGRSDSREALRRFFEVDTGHVVSATLSLMAKEGLVESTAVKVAFDRYDIDPDAPDP